MMNIAIDVVMWNLDGLAGPSQGFISTRIILVWDKYLFSDFCFDNNLNRIWNVTTEGIGTNTWRVYSLHKAAGAIKYLQTWLSLRLHSWGVFYILHNIEITILFCWDLKYASLRFIILRSSTHSIENRNVLESLPSWRPLWRVLAGIIHETMRKCHCMVRCFLILTSWKLTHK